MKQQYLQDLREEIRELEYRHTRSVTQNLRKLEEKEAKIREGKLDLQLVEMKC